MLASSTPSKKQDFPNITIQYSFSCTGIHIITLKASTEGSSWGKTYMISASLDITEQSVRLVFVISDLNAQVSLDRKWDSTTISKQTAAWSPTTAKLLLPKIFSQFA